MVKDAIDQAHPPPTALPATRRRPGRGPLAVVGLDGALVERAGRPGRLRRGWEQPGA